MTDLEPLIDRLQRATGPDDALDRAIRDALDLPAMLVPPDGGDEARPYTASLDAALTLVPNGAPFSLALSGVWAEHTPFAGRPFWEAGIPDRGSEDFEEYTIAEIGDFEASGTAPSPAIALCIAALKARRWSGAG